MLVQVRSVHILVAPAEAKRTVYFPSLQVLTYDFAEFRLERAEFLWQPQTGFEKAMVDGAQLPNERTPWFFCLASGKAGHAVDHGNLFRMKW